ncbi:hypothetical protein [Haloferula sp. BvORR071]|uniref:hypothetical protein n=1 Tax=Haloferula sp. BvORR071 TaxID=1396141 RepID=UPI0005509A2E|nr:hypothetical protein [Haloferula sp. BvORR071]
MSTIPNRVHLLTVQDPLWLPQASMLVVQSVFPHADRNWHNRDERVWVITPDGRELEATAHIQITHLNIRDPDVSIEMRWPVTMWLTDRSAEEVPNGSRIECAPEMRRALLGPETEG